jgi:glycosyltransferase involved in cell wall biosynthesis
LIAEARRLGVQDRIVVKERVPYDQMFDYLSLSNVGLMLYQPNILNHVYAFPMKLYDYMWAALPSIGPDFAVEAAPVITEERCGLCIDTADPVALARALDWLAENPDEARQMGLRAREAVRRTYNWEEQGRRLVRIYESVLGHPGPRDTIDPSTIGVA